MKEKKVSQWFFSVREAGQHFSALINTVFLLVKFLEKTCHQTIFLERERGRERKRSVWKQGCRRESQLLLHLKRVFVSPYFWLLSFSLYFSFSLSLSLSLSISLADFSLQSNQKHIIYGYDCFMSLSFSLARVSISLIFRERVKEGEKKEREERKREKESDSFLQLFQVIKLWGIHSNEGECGLLSAAILNPLNCLSVWEMEKKSVNSLSLSCEEMDRGEKERKEERESARERKERKTWSDLRISLLDFSTLFLTRQYFGMTCGFKSP